MIFLNLKFHQIIWIKTIHKSLNHISLKTTNINPICNDIISACDKLQKLA
jgi:hypothetical protein